METTPFPYPGPLKTVPKTVSPRRLSKNLHFTCPGATKSDKCFQNGAPRDQNGDLKRALEDVSYITWLFPTCVTIAELPSKNPRSTHLEVVRGAHAQPGGGERYDVSSPRGMAFSLNIFNTEKTMLNVVLKNTKKTQSLGP